MHRRRFLQASLLTPTTALTAGCFQQGDSAADTPDSFPTHDLPQYSHWIPDESQTSDSETGVFFTHMDWEMYLQLNTLDAESTPSSNDPPVSQSDAENGVPIADILVDVPIVGLPLYSLLTSPVIVYSILFYPFVNAIIPGNDTTVDGIETESMTWTDDNLLVFHGTYDPDVFAAQYTDGFDKLESRENFTIYTGTNAVTEAMAYAVSENAVIVGIEPDDTDEYTTEAVISSALDRYIDDLNTMVGTTAGNWLCTTIGEAPLVVGYWDIDEFGSALNTTTRGTGTTTSERGGNDTGPERDFDESPVFTRVNSLLATLTGEFEQNRVAGLTAQFAGLYPATKMPSEETFAEGLFGVQTPESQEILTERERVYVSATFTGLPNR